jgi:hypothetical protein
MSPGQDGLLCSEIRTQALMDPKSPASPGAAFSVAARLSTEYEAVICEVLGRHLFPTRHHF